MSEPHGSQRVVALLVALCAACGANVVFAGDDAASSGGGGAGGSQAVGGEGGAGGSSCSAPIQGELHALCLDGLEAPCPPSSSPVVRSAAAEEVATWTCDDACCFYFVTDVPCGPTLSDSGVCCYGADVSLEFCEG